jgi:hypothetical protein
MTAGVPQPRRPLARHIQVTLRGGRWKLNVVEGQPVRIRLPVTTADSPKNMTGTAGRSPGRETSLPTNTSYATGTTAATSHFSLWSFDARSRSTPSAAAEATNEE